MGAVPQQCGDCPMSSVAKGFALHSGAMPPKSGICILLEAPGPDEPVFLVKDLVDGAAEIERRRKQYPTLEPSWITKGAPVVGRAGNLMWFWILAPLNLIRPDVAVFNTISCYPGKGPDGQFFYPTGNVRKRAEATCAELWLRPLLEWQPTRVVEAMHPSALSRDITPLPVVRRAVEKAKMFAARGERVLLIMGGKGAKHFLGYGENTTRWCGHHQEESDFTRRLRFERWNENRRLSVVKVARVKKLTARTALALLLSRAELAMPEFPMTIKLTVAEWETMNALAVVTKKKSKEEVEVV